MLRASVEYNPEENTATVTIKGDTFVEKLDVEEDFNRAFAVYHERIKNNGS